MKRLEAIEKATKIAILIREGVTKLRHTALKDAPLLAMLPFIEFGADAKAGRNTDFDSLDPRIFEILIYGSVADESREEVGDIDIIVFDNGFFSKFFLHKHKNGWYEKLSGNLKLLLTGWLGYSEEKIADILGGVDTDLHVLPLKMLKSEKLRLEIARKHSDPKFFQNAFSSILKQDGVSHELVPTSIDYLAGKYKVDLSDLKG